MKKLSIRFKLTFWFTLILVAGVLVTFFAVRAAGGIVLRRTIRNYLYTTVEENAKKISYKNVKEYPHSNHYIEYGEGYLEIDVDFMQESDNVYTALYKENGTMLYGENPVSLETRDSGFDSTVMWEYKDGGKRYDLYDRKLILELPDKETLWIRGVVSEETAMRQLDEITRISLVLIPILVLITAALGYLLIGRQLAPLRKIENTASRITKGDDLEQRIPVKNKGDEVGSLAASFNHMLDRLESSFEAERQFTSDVSHELRTPVSVILAQSEYTLESERTAEEYEDALRVVYRNGKRMEALISDMLDYTRMEQRSDMYEFACTDLSALTEETAAQMRMIGAKGITLDTAVTEHIFIKGNKMLLARLLSNLISNAYRYGKEEGRIMVSLSTEAGKAVLEVADDGIGIAREEQEKIFDRFYRSEASRTVPGTGLGLSLVKKIAELHGAYIELESEEGAGSTFRIFFEIISPD